MRERISATKHHVARRVIAVMMRPVMPSHSRIPQIIEHQSSLYRSLLPFGSVLFIVTALLIALAVQN